jgi:hypothetical protein
VTEKFINSTNQKMNNPAHQNSMKQKGLIVTNPLVQTWREDRNMLQNLSLSLENVRLETSERDPHHDIKVLKANNGSVRSKIVGSDQVT